MIERYINTKNTISIYIHWLLNYRHYWHVRSLVSSWSFINPNLRHINHAVQTTFPYFVFCAWCRLAFVMVCSSAHVSSQAAAVLELCSVHLCVVQAFGNNGFPSTAVPLLHLVYQILWFIGGGVRNNMRWHVVHITYPNNSFYTGEHPRLVVLQYCLNGWIEVCLCC